MVVGNEICFQKNKFKSKWNSNKMLRDVVVTKPRMQRHIKMGKNVAYVHSMLFRNKEIAA